MTKGRWKRTLLSLGEISGSQIPEYHPDDPDGPLFEGGEDPSEIIIHGHQWDFSATYVKEGSSPRTFWPIPRGMALLIADPPWDKGGPFDDSEDEYIMVGGAIISEMGGDFVNYSNELTFLEVETYTGFLKCNYNTILLSRRVLEDAGLENLQRFGRITDKEGFIQLDTHGPGQSFAPELYDLLKSLDYLRPESEMHPAPALDEDAIGLTVQMNYHPNEKRISDKERPRKEDKARGRASFDKEFEQKYGHVFDLEELEAWATDQADRAIAG
ncbi:MAG: hypothetical protein KAS77_13310, partial [Thermoplasmata archaeon]|nr:hypothetical protein [Thermoplasmata archaeon]